MSLLRFISDNLQVCALLGFYAAHGGTLLRTFREKPVRPVFKGQVVQEKFLSRNVSNKYAILHSVKAHKSTHLIYTAM